MKQLFLFFFFFTAFIYAQNDSITILDEVKLHGNFTKKFNAGFKIQIISDTIINKATLSLGDLLQKNANLYFKQNGNGMVSSISLRGTGASHTGVYWNGIAINSSLNGQTDFNTLSANGFNQIEIRKGAASTLFGSGAIGGAINLKDKTTFTPTLKKEFTSTVGLASFNSQNLFVQSKFSAEKYYVKISVLGNKSDNDYPFLNTDPQLFNENGKFNNYQIKSAFAYKISQNNQLKLFTIFNNNYRELSRTISAPSNSLLKNKDNKLMLNWLNTNTNYNSDFKLAYINESYQFFIAKELNNFSFGKTDNYIAKYDFKYLLKNKKSILFGFDNKFTQSNGSSILKKERNIFEIYALYHQELFNKLTYNLSIRKGKTKAHKIPLIYSVDTKFDINKNWNFRANYSTNYRIPTFNDLYWENSGNENLIPETNNSSEIGIYFKNKKLNFNLISFITKSNDLIQWKPESANLWKPVNIQSVTSKGIEFDFNYLIQLNQHKINVNTQYSFTKSIDNTLKKQLIYVPNNKTSTNLNYQYKNWSFNYNFEYFDTVFITTSNTQILSDFNLSAIEFSKTFFNDKWRINFYINNLFNKNYQIVSYRPMPGRNYKLNINFKI